jgi:hypothetical protein
VGELDVETARWLTSDAGRAAVASAARRLDDGADELAVASGLRTVSAYAERRAAVLDAASARRRARPRWPNADELLFTREGLEQASDPAVAAHRAGRLLAELDHRSMTTDSVVDLCAGIGGDAIALARAAAEVGLRVLAVDTDAARLMLLAHNAEAAGVTVSILEADALTIDLPPRSVVHADPSRRRDGRRIRPLAEHLPSVPALLAAHPDAEVWALALAPGVDVEDPDLPGGVEVEYVQLNGDLVEATVWIGSTGTPSRATATDRPPSPNHASAQRTAVGSPDRAADGERRARATLLTDDGVAGTRVGVPASRVRLPVGGIGRFLIEVAPAAVRARLHDDLGRDLGARRIAAHRALLTSDREPPASPWYRARPVLAQLSPRPRAVRRWLHDRAAATGGPEAVELVLHGVTADPDVLWRELGRPRRGPQGLRVEFIRRDHDSLTVVTGR